jgi:zinc transporter ZupT
MIFTLLVLFFTPLLSGLIVFLLPKGRTTNYRMLLVFAGAYLFAITVIHILPELYAQSSGLQLIGLFVLIGFFLQQLLEYITSGIEHGHIHSHTESTAHHHSVHHYSVSAIMLLFALCKHAFLEGGMLAQPLNARQVFDTNAILLGIALHRAPAAFALMTVLAVQLRSRSRGVPYLVAFSAAAPIGLLVSSYLTQEEVLSTTGLVYLYALVSGNFLHISTTIVFESSPGHRFDARKMATALFGALVAVGVEFVI